MSNAAPTGNGESDFQPERERNDEEYVSGSEGRVMEQEQDNTNEDYIPNQQPRARRNGEMLRPDVYEEARPPWRLTWDYTPGDTGVSLDNGMLPPLPIATNDGEIYHNRRSFLYPESKKSKPRRDTERRNSMLGDVMTPDDLSPTIDAHKPEQFDWSDEADHVSPTDYRRGSVADMFAPGTGENRVSTEAGSTAVATSTTNGNEETNADPFGDFDSAPALHLEEAEAPEPIPDPLSPGHAAYLARQREVLNDMAQVDTGERPAVHPATTEEGQTIARRYHREYSSRIEIMRQEVLKREAEIDRIKQESHLEGREWEKEFAIQTEELRDAKAQGTILRSQLRRAEAMINADHQRADRLETQRTAADQRANHAEEKLERMKKDLARAASAEKALEHLPLEITKLQDENASLKQQLEAKAQVPAHSNNVQINTVQQDDNSKPTGYSRISDSNEAGEENNASSSNTPRPNANDNTNNNATPSPLSKDEYISKLEQDLKACKSHGASLELLLSQNTSAKPNSDPNIDPNDMDTIKQENSHLKQRIAELESQIKYLTTSSANESPRDASGADDGPTEDEEDPCPRCNLSKSERDDLLDQIDNFAHELRESQQETASVQKQLQEQLDEMQEDIDAYARDLAESRHQATLFKKELVDMEKQRERELGALARSMPLAVSTSPIAGESGESVATERVEFVAAQRLAEELQSQLEEALGVQADLRQELGEKLVEDGEERVRVAQLESDLARARETIARMTTRRSASAAAPAATSEDEPGTLQERIERAEASHRTRLEVLEEKRFREERAAGQQDDKEVQQMRDLKMYWRRVFGIDFVFDTGIKLWEDTPLATQLKGGKGKRVTA
ncbi:hypothetical protein KVT40_004117 [Elsinoe batatas]|uniref:Uncharacterized protein n=1 Tax=Elsinoe batatas TaxID=2601811 RepID=A0A8K0PJY1_9PEZI|nr:hypothetical protein KVT40_004117 [Elsinoe batatas]